MTTDCLERDRQYVLMTYHILSISILIALYVESFASACTLSAEVFITLFFFFWGFNVVQVLLIRFTSSTNAFQGFRSPNILQFRVLSSRWL